MFWHFGSEVTLENNKRRSLCDWSNDRSAGPFARLLPALVALGPLPSDGRENGVEEVEESGDVGHHHCSDVQSVVFE